ncbi:LOW QUALITY PROTEIN: uncharacterized protein [Diabrotica undecimpunctata]|uniref:LOW QUALITY PROTEIN: uncharacterized protein n=1 Tax=Diabrotica undecimpunctata TaxID=50387 RepID=UPI003B638290
MKKIDQVEGFENLMRDNTIGIDDTRQTPDHTAHLLKVKLEDESPLQDIIVPEVVESNGEIINRTSEAMVNGLQTSDPTVISNLLKEASTASHLPTVIPPEPTHETQTDKNHYHHKSKKKNKDKHKHKDKNREDKEKKKKHKDKDREKHRHKDKAPEVTAVPIKEPLKLKIPKDKIIMEPAPSEPPQGLKIKIPKNIINTENISELSNNPPPIGIKLKIPKEKLNNCPNIESSASRKRERDKDRGSPDGPASKISKSSIKESKTNGRYSNNNKVSPNVDNNIQNVQQQTNFVTNQTKENTNNFQMYTAPPPLPPPPPPPPAQQALPHVQMYYYNQMPPPPMPNVNVPPPSYMYQYYNQGYMYQRSGMYAHPPPMQAPLPVMHSSNSRPPLPMDAPPQAPPPPPE